MLSLGRAHLFWESPPTNPAPPAHRHSGSTVEGTRGTHVEHCSHCAKRRKESLLIDGSWVLISCTSPGYQRNALSSVGHGLLTASLTHFFRRHWHTPML